MFWLHKHMEVVELKIENIYYAVAFDMINSIHKQNPLISCMTNLI